MLRKYILALLLFSTTLIAHSLEITVNGFGTAGVERSNIRKIGTIAAPVIPPLGVTTGSRNPTSIDLTIRPRYIGAERRWNFSSLSKVGLQFTGVLSDKFTAAIQLLGRGDNQTPGENFLTRMDWAYLTYQYSDNLDAKVGRVRIPLFYYSDNLNVGYTYPWIEAPVEVYYLLPYPFMNIDGVKLTYKKYTESAAYTIGFYTGSIESKVEFLLNDYDPKCRHLSGMNVGFENDNFVIRGAFTVGAYDVPVNTLAKQQFAVASSAGVDSEILRRFSETIVDENYRAFTGNISASYHWHDYQLLGELSGRSSEDGPVIFNRVGWYIALIRDWDKFSLIFTHGYTRPTRKDRESYAAQVDFYMQNPGNAVGGTGNRANLALLEIQRSLLASQRTWRVTGRYDVNHAVALKGEVEAVVPNHKPTNAYHYIGIETATLRRIWVYRLAINYVM